jgi:hypothetical protein
MSKEKYKQSVTEFIKRSAVNFAPYNPKNHTKENIDEIKRNIKRVGFLGGVIWNKTTGNLIDGHKRVTVLDIINNYTGNNDYDLKVEVVEFDIKTEKEQNVFQSVSRTDIDSTLLAEIITDIDFEFAGLTEEDIKVLEVEVPNFVFTTNEDAKEFHETTIEEKAKNKEAIKEAKNKYKQLKEAANYVTLTFDNFENKAYFMERFGLDHYAEFIKGERFSNSIERID